MKIKITLLILLGSFIISKSTNAQVLGGVNQRYSEYLWHINVGVEGLLNMSSGSNTYSPGIGGTVRVQRDLTQNAAVTFTTGGYVMPGKDKGGIDTENLKLLAFKLGAKAYFSPNLYFLGEVGVASAYPYIDPKTQSHFSKIISPAIGYETSQFDASLAFMNVHHHSNYVSNIVLRVAYNFNF